MKFKYVSAENLQYIDKLLFELNNTVVEGNYPGKHKSLLIGKSLDFVQHREYVYGDDIKSIDWKVYARRDRFFIKQYQQETNLVVNIYLDCSSSMWYPFAGRIKKYEYGSYMVSYLSYVILSQSDSVSVVKFSNVIEESLGPSSQKSFYYKILSFLDNEICAKQTDFNFLVDYILKTEKKRSVVIIISDLISDDEVKLVKLLQQISAYGIYLILIHIVDKDEMSLQLGYENCTVKYIEDDSVSVRTNLQEIQKFYEKEFAKLVEYYTQHLNGKNSRYVFINTSLPILTNLKFVLQI